MDLVDTAELTWNVSVPATERFLVNQVSHEAEVIDTTPSYLLRSTENHAYILTPEPGGSVSLQHESTFKWKRSGKQFWYRNAENFASQDFLFRADSGDFFYPRAGQYRSGYSDWTCTNGLLVGDCYPDCAGWVFDEPHTNLHRGLVPVFDGGVFKFPETLGGGLNVDISCSGNPYPSSMTFISSFEAPGGFEAPNVYCATWLVNENPVAFGNITADCKTHQRANNFDPEKFSRHGMLDMGGIDCPTGNAITSFSAKYDLSSQMLTFKWQCCKIPGDLGTQETNKSHFSTPGKKQGCARNSVLVSMSWDNDGTLTAQCYEYATTMGISNPELTPQQLSFPNYFLRMTQYQPSKIECFPTDSVEVIHSTTFPLGTCEADIYVQNPLPVNFAEGHHACVADSMAPTAVTSVPSSVKWHCQNDWACFGYSRTGTNDSGPGYVYHQPIQASQETPGNCFVKVLDSTTPQVVPLELKLQDLTTELRQAYDTTPSVQLQTTASHEGGALFTCLQTDQIASGLSPASPFSFPCARGVSMQLGDLMQLRGTYLDTISHPSLLPTVQRTCASLIGADSTNASNASMTAEAGLYICTPVFPLK